MDKIRLTIHLDGTKLSFNMDREKAWKAIRDWERIVDNACKKGILVDGSWDWHCGIIRMKNINAMIITELPKEEEWRESLKEDYES